MLPKYIYCGWILLNLENKRLLIVCVSIYIYIYIFKNIVFMDCMCVYMCVCVCVYIYFVNTCYYVYFLWSAWVIYHVLKFQMRKEIKGPQSEEEKSYLSTNQYFRCISLFKNPIDSRLDGLEPWLKYLQLLCFEFFEIH